MLILGIVCVSTHVFLLLELLPIIFVESYLQNFPGLVLRIRTLGRCSEYIRWSATFSPQSMLLQQSKNVQCDTVTCERWLKSLKRPTPHTISSLFLVGSMWGGKSSKRNFRNPYVVGLFPQSSSPARVSLVNPGSLGVFSHSCSGPFGG